MVSLCLRRRTPCFWLLWLRAAAMIRAALVLRPAQKLQQLQLQLLLLVPSHQQGPRKGQSWPVGLMEPQAVWPPKLLAVGGARIALLLPQSPMVLVRAPELVQNAQACGSFRRAGSDPVAAAQGGCRVYAGARSSVVGKACWIPCECMAGRAADREQACTAPCSSRMTEWQPFMADMELQWNLVACRCPAPCPGSWAQARQGPPQEG